MFWNKYPYTNFHELNLDWILQKIKEMDKSLSEFEALNKITFDGEWDITKQYPAWCIVNTNGGTEGYISIQPVPAGVVITNTDYWVSIVNYTATIADLQNRVVALEGDVASLSNDVEALSADKILMIGDSIAVAQNADSKTFYELFAEYLGMTVGVDAFTEAISARGFTTTHATKANFKVMFDEFWTEHPALDPSEFKAVIVTGGANDISQSVSTIESAIVTFINDVKATCVNAKVYIGVNTRNAVNSAGSAGFKNNYLPGYMTAEKHGAVFLHGLEYVLFNSALQYDKLHPTSDGVNKLADGLYSAYTTGTAHIITSLVNSSANFTPDSNVSSITNLNMLSEFQEDDVITIAPSGFSTMTITLVSAYSGGAIALGTMDNNIWYNTTNDGLMVMCPPVKVTHSDNTTEFCHDAILYKSLNTYVLISPSGFSNVKSVTIPRTYPVARSASVGC